MYVLFAFECVLVPSVYVYVLVLYSISSSGRMSQHQLMVIKVGGLGVARVHQGWPKSYIVSIFRLVNGSRSRKRADLYSVCIYHERAHTCTKVHISTIIGPSFHLDQADESRGLFRVISA